MNIIVVGCGGREHAILKKFSESFLKPQKPQLYCVGDYLNPSIVNIVGRDNYLVASDVHIVAAHWNVTPDAFDFVIIGPEVYLRDKWTDYFLELGVPVLGPTGKQAMIETSKSFARNLLENHYHSHLSPAYQVVERREFESDHEILQALHAAFAVVGETNFVVKADGLMGGKGVKVFGDHLSNVDEGIGFAMSLLKKPGDKVVIEEKLCGQEFSLMSLTDGVSFVHFPIVQDNKRAYDGDKGPNTGGMGCISYANHRLPFLSKTDVKTAQKINEMVVTILNATDTKFGSDKVSRGYRGIIYGSFMKTNGDDDIKVIEFNARFGDPECISALRVLKNDFALLCYHAARGTLYTQFPVSFSRLGTVCKYVVPTEYPNHQYFAKDIGDIVEIPKDTDQVYAIYNSIETHPTLDNTLVTRGSRTVAFVAAARFVRQAEELVENHIRSGVHGNVRWRSDIGKRTKPVEAEVAVLTVDAEADAEADIDDRKNDFEIVVTPMDQKPDNAGNLSDSKESGDAYTQAGVNINEGNLAIQKIQKYVRSTYTNDVTSDFGDFAGIMKVENGCHLVFSTDGVGTKSDVVLGHYGIKGYFFLGMDIVNHCINDTLVKGALPFAFLDYYGTSKLNSDALKYLVKGAAKACQTAGCVLIGGETAEMPGTYQHEKCDVVGTIVGRVSPSDVINGKRDIKPGNVVMAFSSNSPHTNGYSLIRKLLAENKELREDQQFMEEISRPHRSYLREIQRLQTNYSNVKINGLCHITGGGLIENPPRVLPNNCAIKWDSWEWPRIYRRIQQVGKISNDEMLRVFNCGIGMLVIVPEESAPALEVLFFDCFKIGTVVEK